MFFQKAFDATAQVVQNVIEQGSGYILDVRGEEEYAEGHLPTSHLIPLPVLEEHLSELSKDRSIYIYCRSGQRANTAKRILLSAGFTNVYNVGGVIQWPYELER